MEKMTGAHMTRWMDVYTTRHTERQPFGKEPSQGGVLQSWFQIDRWKYLQSPKSIMDGCAHAQNRQTDGHQSQNQLCPGGVLSPC